MRPLYIAAVILAAASPSRAATPAPLVCAAGYHIDRGGNCQPDVEEANRYCPRGLVFHPTFDSWTCDPPPPQAY